LNFFYGVTVEDALLLSIRMKCGERHLAAIIKKKTRTGGGFFSGFTPNPTGFTGAVPQRETHRRLRQSGLSELKQFTYWLSCTRPA